MTLQELNESKAKFVLKIFKRTYNMPGKSDDAGSTEETVFDVTAADMRRKELSFDLKPLQSYDNVLAVEGIRVDGKIITFENTQQKVQVDLWAIQEDRPPIVYQDVVIDRGQDYNSEISEYLIVRPVNVGARINKRKSFRVKVGIKCQVQLHAHGGVVPGVIRDVSTDGFAVEISPDLISEANIKDTLSVEFTDMMISPEIMRITGLCMRIVKENSYVLYGCMVLDASKAYKSYVMQRQAKKAKAKGDA